MGRLAKVLGERLKGRLEAPSMAARTGSSRRSEVKAVELPGRNGGAMEERRLHSNWVSFRFENSNLENVFRVNGDVRLVQRKLWPMRSPLLLKTSRR